MATKEEVMEKLKAANTAEELEKVKSEIDSLIASVKAQASPAPATATQ